MFFAWRCTLLLYCERTLLDLRKWVAPSIFFCSGVFLCKLSHRSLSHIAVIWITAQRCYHFCDCVMSVAQNVWLFRHYKCSNSASSSVSQEWSPSHNLKSLRKKQMAAREAMARQTVSSDSDPNSVESSVIRWNIWHFFRGIVIIHNSPITLCWTLVKSGKQNQSQVHITKTKKPYQCTLITNKWIMQ